MIKIKNSDFCAIISETGAELKSYANTKHKKEYIWNSDPKFWGKSFPILFPNIGFLKNNKTLIENKEYNIPKHGIARTGVFKASQPAKNRAVLTFGATAETLESFPFNFNMSVTYTLYANRLEIDYLIKNDGEKTMPYCLGLHPAFSCPCTRRARFCDYSLVFEKYETLDSPLISKSGTIELTKRVKYMSESRELPLNYEMFENDALIFEKLNSSSVSLKGPESNLEIRFSGFSSLGLWTPPGAPFICIEPWCGMNDRSDENGIFENKFGIQTLLPKEEKNYSLEIEPMEV